MEKKELLSIETLTDRKIMYDKEVPEFGYFFIVIISIFVIGVLFWSTKAKKVEIIEVNGTIESAEKNYIVSEFSGKIVEIFVEEGALIEAGEKVLEIESTETNVQLVQLEEQRQYLNNQEAQYQKLVKSIKDDHNYFDVANEKDSLFYSQYEAYQRQIAQSTVNVEEYVMFGYSEERIEDELKKNSEKIAEIYYATLQNIEENLMDIKLQQKNVDAQILAIKEAKEEYVIKAAITGRIHFLGDYKEGMLLQASSTVGSISKENDTYIVNIQIDPSYYPQIEVGDKVDLEIKGASKSIYGTIEGEIKEIDSDFSIIQTDVGSKAYFKAEILPHITYLVSKEGKKVNLSNGMEVWARIKSDEMTYFNYFLDLMGVNKR